MHHLALWCVSVFIYVSVYICQDEEEDEDALNPGTYVSAYIHACVEASQEDEEAFSPGTILRRGLCLCICVCVYM